jgi:hypothetical protein
MLKINKAYSNVGMNAALSDTYFLKYFLKRKEAKTPKAISMASELTRGESEFGHPRGHKGRTHGTKRAEITAPERKRTATSKGGKQTLCQKHADEIHTLLLDKQLALAKIAETLCIMNLYPPHTITPKQVSNWIRYNVQEGSIKPPPVTGTAVRAKWTLYDCLLFTDS